MIASIILILFILILILLVTSLIAIIKTTFFKSNKSPKIKNSDNFIKQNQNNTFEKQSVNDNDMYLPINTFLQNGKYKIEKVLGSGTFGITYLATAKVKVGGSLGNMEATIKVAIKEFFMEAINGRTGTSVTSGNTDGTYDKYKKKFIKEAQNMSKMNHPNIVKVSDIFEANNTCYYVMEYCEGGSLDGLIKRKGSLSETESLNYIRQIAVALKYMHDNKMLHLDLKPGNVVLRENGEAVLIDFGLSKQFDKSGKPETSTNIGLGTPGYAPIEQSNYDGTSLPVTMDVYALGGTWFKMLTGTCPPDASTILNQGFPAYELQNKNVSERSVQCIARAMQPLYKDRIQGVGEFMKMLGGCETKNEGTVLYENEVYEEKKPEPTPEPLPTPSPTPNPNKMRKILLLILLLIGGICGYFIVNNIQEKKAEQVRLEQARIEQERKEVEEKMQNDKREYLDYIVEGDALLSSKQYSLAINKYEQAQTYEDKYKNTEYSGEFDKSSEEKIKNARAAKTSYETEQARLEKQRKEKAAEQARLEQARKEKEAAEQARLEKARKEKEAAEQARLEKERKEREQYAKSQGSISGHEWVDLGLPSGLKWATCNVGADSPEDYGNYFAWGEVNTKAYYTGENSKTYENSSYENKRDIGGDKSLDAARANWGSSWRLPTKAEFEELENKCTWKWTTQKRVKGYKVTGPNGNSIFLPAAGSSGEYVDGEYGYYWSSTSYGRVGYYFAYSLIFYSECHYVSSELRLYGQSVRPVSE